MVPYRVWYHLEAQKTLQITAATELYQIVIKSRSHHVYERHQWVKEEKISVCQRFFGAKKMPPLVELNVVFASTIIS